MRLFRALLIVRALLPTATLVVLLAAAARGDASLRSTGVWGFLAIWTIATTIPLWSRLGWARAMPVPVRVEIAVFVALVFAGFGTRPWHLLHSFVPLAFVSLFVGARSGIVVGAAIVASLWAVYATFALWPGAPLEPRLAATVPTVIVAGSALLIGYVRRLLADIEAIVAVRSAAVEAIDQARARLAIDEASAEVYRRVSERLAPIAERVRAAGETIFSVGAVNGSDHSGRTAALKDCLDAISASFDELVDAGGAVGEEPRRARSGKNTLLAEIERAVAATNALGGAVTVQAEPADAMPVGDDELHALRRLLREAVVNARKHGMGHVYVRVPPGDDRVIEIENEAANRTISERAGGVGLEAMRGDAAAIGAKLQVTTESGLARVAVSLPMSRTTSRELSDGDEAMRAALGRRRGSYTATLLALRLTAAGLTAATIQLEATKHRSLLPALTVTSAVLIAWNAGLLASHARGLWSRSAGRLFATVDAVVICGLIFAEGGMASPWFALSIGSLVLLGLMRGARALVSFAGAFSFSMLGGYFLVRGLGLDDLGTAQQEMPFGLILNVFIYAAAVAIVVAVGWAFARLEDAITEHERLGLARRSLERSAAGTEANNHVRRALHASLQQYVHAALVNLGTLDVARGLEAQRALEQGLSEMRDRLAEVFTELQQRPSPVNEGVSLA